MQLNRTFRELSKRFRDSDESDLTRAFFSGHSLSWPDLLKRYRTVILSEAGSGKTEEIRQVASQLRSKRKAAFFLRLEHIAEDFEDAFEIGTFEEFSAWLGTGGEGWLFLDSVDESRLRHPSDFELAIRKTSRRLRGARDRTHVVITGRTSAWRPKTDLALCKQHLPFVFATAQAANPSTGSNDDDSPNGETFQTEQRSDTDDPAEFTIVALDNLSEEQIRIFAHARGIQNTQVPARP